MDFSSDASSMNVPAKFEVRSFTCSWVNRGTQKLGRSLAMPTKGEAVGVGDGTVRKSVGEFLQAVYSNLIRV